MKPTYLRTRRERLGLTQEQLAAKAKVAQNTISKLESGVTAQGDFETRVALATALKVNPLQLRFGPDPRRRARAGTRRKAVAA